MSSYHRTQTHREACIRVCNDCAATCAATSIHCLDMGGDHASPEHQTILLDCVDICSTAARLLARDSPHHPGICRACVEFCNRCAKECEQMLGADEQMSECAEVCRRCATSCEQMATSPA